MQPLYDRLFDYAGVFPPAGHTVEEATRRYRAAVAGPDGWIMGPMLLRASQLTDYDGEDVIGVVADIPISGRFAQVEKRTEPGHTARTIAELVDLAPVVYLECSDPTDGVFLRSVADARTKGQDVRAKIRTGGATAEAFPTPGAVADFIRSCLGLEIPFKATAGLHHPIRTSSGVEGAIEHGFINMLAAVRCALGGHDDRVEMCLSETDPAMFDAGTATWRGVGGEVAEPHIRSAFTSIGSCSFDEPAGYLRRLGVL